MAIKYLDAKRIRGSSVGENTITFEDDFDTDAWSDVGTKILVDTTGQTLDFDVDERAVKHQTAYDLGSTMSDSAWVLRAKINYTTVTQGSSGNSVWRLYLGLSSTNHSSHITADSQDFLGMANQISPSGASNYLRINPSSFENSATATEGTVMSHTLQTETVYVEIIRADPTTLTLEFFSDSGYSTSVEKETMTVSSGINNLQYIKVGNSYSAAENAVGQELIGTIDDIKFYNGVTSATQDDKSTITNVPVGTRYEETDTRKIYRMATVPNVIIDFGAGGEATEGNWTHPSTDSGGNSGAHGFSVTTESSLTGSAGTIDITGRDWDSTIDMVTHCGLATALPAQTKFVIDWDFYRHSDDTSDHPVFAFSSEAHGVDPRGGNSSKEVAWACEQNNQDDSPYDGQNSIKLYCKNSSGTSYGNIITVSGDSTSLQTKGETRYWRCIYGETGSSGNLAVRLQRYDTAANRTAGGATGRELNLVSTGWDSATAQTAWEAGDPIRYFTLLTYNNGQKAFSIDNITWYDDSLTAVAKVPSWKEKGAA